MGNKWLRGRVKGQMLCACVSKFMPEYFIALFNEYKCLNMSVCVCVCLNKFQGMEV